MNVLRVDRGTGGGSAKPRAVFQLLMLHGATTIALTR